MTTYYRDGSVQVTETAVDVDGRCYPVCELSYVWHRRGRPDRRAVGRLAVRLGLITLLVAPFAARTTVATRIWTSDRSLADKLTNEAVLVVVSLTALALLLPLIEIVLTRLERSYDRGARAREIWVRWQDRNTMLLRTADAARFGRIYRAIERAVEQDDRAHTAHRLRQLRKQQERSAKGRL